jgi:two-component system, OmpR family, sensor kinase
LFLIFTYLLGLKIAGKFLKPMQKAAQQTRDFAENCYHELLTPLTVAMTTIDATKQSKTYEKGIESLDEDLKNMYYSLQTLNKNAVENNQHTIEDSTDISQLTENLVAKIQPIAQEKNSKIITHISSSVHKKIDATSAKIIFQNILMNAVKYAEQQTKIEIHLDQKTFSVKNTIQNPKDIDIKQLFNRGYRGENTKEIEGNGFGLAIVKDLCETYGWKIDAELKNNEVIVVVEMK